MRNSALADSRRKRFNLDQAEGIRNRWIRENDSQLLRGNCWKLDPVDTVCEGFFRRALLPGNILP